MPVLSSCPGASSLTPGTCPFTKSPARSPFFLRVSFFVPASSLWAPTSDPSPTVKSEAAPSPGKGSSLHQLPSQSVGHEQRPCSEETHGQGVTSRHSGLPPCAGTHWHCREQLDLEQRDPLCCAGTGGYTEMQQEESALQPADLASNLHSFTSQPHKPTAPPFPHLKMGVTVLAGLVRTRGNDFAAGAQNQVTTLLGKAEEGKLTFTAHLVFARCCTYAFLL